MPLPLDTRKRPADVKVHVTSGAGVDITWADGHSSHYEFAYLRNLCPCALCNDERQKKLQAAASGKTDGDPPGTAPAQTFAPLPMFKPKTTARAVKPAGNYALHMEFTDGHASGIYSYEYLREICPCAECEKEFRAATM